MWLDIVWVVLGLFFLIAVMALVMNPPEDWLKRVFTGRDIAKPKSKKD
jgi:predicted PurR-regulated permease PerM